MLNMIDDVAADVWCPTECYSPRKSPPMNHVVIKYLYVEAAGRISGERSIISFVTSGIGGRRRCCFSCYRLVFLMLRFKLGFQTVKLGRSQKTKFYIVQGAVGRRCFCFLLYFTFFSQKFTSFSRRKWYGSHDHDIVFIFQGQVHDPAGIHGLHDLQGVGERPEQWGDWDGIHVSGEEIKHLPKANSLLFPEKSRPLETAPVIIWKVFM